MTDIAKMYDDSTNEHSTEDTRRNRDASQYMVQMISNPFTQFALAFSALIHDVGHHGVPNVQLVKEKTDDSIHYQNKSVAEQKSVDIAWNLLMKSCYKDLRGAIYTTQSELDLFRQLVVREIFDDFCILFPFPLVYFDAYYCVCFV